MANLFFLLFLFMFNFIKIGTNMLKKEDWQHQSNKYANACAASISKVLNILQQWLQVTTSNYETPKRLQHRRFPMNFAKFLRILFYRTPPLAASGNGSSIFSNVTGYIKLYLPGTLAAVLKKALFQKSFLRTHSFAKCFSMPAYWKTENSVSFF